MGRRARDWRGRGPEAQDLVRIAVRQCGVLVHVDRLCGTTDTRRDSRRIQSTLFVLFETPMPLFDTKLCKVQLTRCRKPYRTRSGNTESGFFPITNRTFSTDPLCQMSGQIGFPAPRRHSLESSTGFGCRGNLKSCSTGTSTSPPPGVACVAKQSCEV